MSTKHVNQSQHILHMNESLRDVWVSHGTYYTWMSHSIIYEWVTAHILHTLMRYNSKHVISHCRHSVTFIDVTECLQWLMTLWHIWGTYVWQSVSRCYRQMFQTFIDVTDTCHKSLKTLCNIERWGAVVETQKNVRGEIGEWGRVPFNGPYAPSLSTIYDGS